MEPEVLEEEMFMSLAGERLKTQMGASPDLVNVADLQESDPLDV